MPSESSADVPKMTEMAPVARRFSIAVRSAAGVEPVTSAHGISAAVRSGPIFSAYCFASTDVGAIMAACVPESATAASARAATTVLPVPTSPKSSRFIISGAAISWRMSCAAALCSSVSSKGRAAKRARFLDPSIVWAKGVSPSHSKVLLARSAI